MTPVWQKRGQGSALWLHAKDLMQQGEFPGQSDSLHNTSWLSKTVLVVLICFRKSTKSHANVNRDAGVAVQVGGMLATAAAHEQQRGAFMLIHVLSKICLKGFTSCFSASQPSYIL